MPEEKMLLIRSDSEGRGVGKEVVYADEGNCKGKLGREKGESARKRCDREEPNEGERTGQRSEVEKGHLSRPTHHGLS